MPLTLEKTSLKILLTTCGKSLRGTFLRIPRELRSYFLMSWFHPRMDFLPCITLTFFQAELTASGSFHFQIQFSF